MKPRDMIEMRLVDALKVEACPFCILSDTDERRYISHILTDEVVMNADYRDMILERGGFCNRHYHLLLESRASAGTGSLGLDIYLKDLMSETAQNLKDALSTARRSGRRGGVRGRKHGTGSAVVSIDTSVLSGKCPICWNLIQAERRDEDAMLRLFVEYGREAASTAGRKMCVPHLLSFIQRAAAERAPDSVICEVLEEALESVTMLEKKLVSRIDRYSWNRRDTPLTADETRVAADAVMKLAGRKGLHL